MDKTQFIKRMKEQAEDGTKEAIRCRREWRGRGYITVIWSACSFVAGAVLLPHAVALVFFVFTALFAGMSCFTFHAAKRFEREWMEFRQDALNYARLAEQGLL